MLNIQFTNIYIVYQQNTFRHVYVYGIFNLAPRKLIYFIAFKGVGRWTAKHTSVKAYVRMCVPTMCAHVCDMESWYVISMSKCNKDVTPLLTQWSYVFLALTHRSNNMFLLACFFIWDKATDELLHMLFSMFSKSCNNSSPGAQSPYI